MILLDCGNSQIKAQFHDSARLRASFSSSYKGNWCARLRRWMQGQAARQCFFSSVLDSARQTQLNACLAQQFDAAVTRFTSQKQALGVTNGYLDPARLGDDRWMALLAAAGMVDGDCLVIDAGSAITLDLLRADGHHLGGAILPGFNTSTDDFKRIFSYIDFEHAAIEQKGSPGCSTEAAIHIDYDHPSTETLPALVNRWIEIFTGKADVLLAGGDAFRVQRLLEGRAHIAPDLVFRGILRLASA
ncbi:MAG: type III pantothenate kinase [Gammaproteobacteria bacterium]|nr:type III pantothenate kinase [Gammaproteobacteria bacterium]